jgi:hypothetical protein
MNIPISEPSKSELKKTKINRKYKIKQFADSLKNNSYTKINSNNITNGIKNLSQYSSNVAKCLANYAKKVQECGNGDIGCLKESAAELRECMDIVFPPSAKTEFESDKENYMMSAIFFLLNRFAKSMIGLSEFDKSMEEFERQGKESFDSDEYKIIYENQKAKLNEILAKYF